MCLAMERHTVFVEEGSWRRIHQVRQILRDYRHLGRECVVITQGAEDYSQGKKTTLVVNLKQHAVMSAVQEKKCQELQKVMERMRKTYVHGTQTEVDGRSPRT